MFAGFGGCSGVLAGPRHSPRALGSDMSIRRMCVCGVCVCGVCVCVCVCVCVVCVCVCVCVVCV